DEYQAGEETKGTADLFVFMSEKKSIVVTCVLSPISARKIVTKTEKKVFQGRFEVTLLFFGYGRFIVASRRQCAIDVRQNHRLTSLIISSGQRGALATPGGAISSMHLSSSALIATAAPLRP